MKEKNRAELELEIKRHKASLAKIANDYRRDARMMQERVDALQKVADAAQALIDILSSDMSDWELASLMRTLHKLEKATPLEVQE
jgi:replicative DNA helicase